MARPVGSKNKPTYTVVSALDAPIQTQGEQMENKSYDVEKVVFGSTVADFSGRTTATMGQKTHQVELKYIPNIHCVVAKCVKTEKVMFLPLTNIRQMLK